MGSKEVVEKAAKVFIKAAITNAADDALSKLQDLAGIKTGDWPFDVATDIDEHLEALVNDYCDIFKAQLSTVIL